MNDLPPSAENRDHIFKLLKSFETAMLVTHTEPDALRARPMAIAAVDDEGLVWFISNEDTAKVHEIEVDTRVHLTCQREPSIYLSLEGFATVVSDHHKIAELWKERFRPWFPRGKDDPTVLLIVVQLTAGEFWDSKSTLKALFSLTSGKVEEEHALVRL